MGVRHGSGNRSLLTMRSGLIKIRRGLQEFTWGLSQFVIKGLHAYRVESETERERELDDLYQKQQEERLKQSEICAINKQVQQESESIKKESFDEKNKS